MTNEEIQKKVDESAENIASQLSGENIESKPTESKPTESKPTESKQTKTKQQVNTETKKSENKNTESKQTLNKTEEKLKKKSEEKPKINLTSNKELILLLSKCNWLSGFYSGRFLKEKENSELSEEVIDSIRREMRNTPEWNTEITELKKFLK